ncbi:hypothetical protein PSTEL_25360 [Paenibacillus stellifer]|uniref:AB hydrolase-1 domain-containing protein n=1 Tax=Paenibacillus stellifer TaxID=169760 RepID=A0A089M3A7_9BACL|nr:alpha/beta hydrolase [Paenibacillus stellifer]AIQ65948.1 hypothetical protein PSTEL_25360 [Paenibacillus stellifer]
MTLIRPSEKVLRATISVLGFPMTVIQAVLSMRSLHKHKAPGEIISIGGRSLHAIVSGRGDSILPTIILESGMGGSALDWSLVQPALAKYTRVVAYDRAGFGWSTQTMEEPTCANYVQDLRRLLAQKKLEPPYLLVGHSFGGLIMRLFASQYPEEVSGLVLVDSTHEKRYIESHFNHSRRQEQLRYQKRLRLGFLLSPIGLTRIMKQHIGTGKLPPAIQNKVTASGYRNHAYKAAYLEFLHTSVSADQIIESSPLRPDMPVMVLTAGRQNEAWKESQRELLQLTDQTRQRIIEDSWHSIPIHKPQAVVQSVLGLLYRAD